ncbi:hypothetical protein [Arthrobacter sp. HLT1-20]
MADQDSFPGLRVGDVVKVSASALRELDGIDVGNFLLISLRGGAATMPSFKLSDEAAAISSMADEMGVRVAKIEDVEVTLKVISTLESGGRD